MIEGLNTPPGGDGLGVFGKGLRQGKIRDALAKLGITTGFEDLEGEDLSSFVNLRAQRGTPPMYDPDKLYGGLYRSYGGQRVRGGLLGE